LENRKLKIENRRRENMITHPAAEAVPLPRGDFL
jgi:hypothetical protein